MSGLGGVEVGGVLVVAAAAAVAVVAFKLARFRLEPCAIPSPCCHSGVRTIIMCLVLMGRVRDEGASMTRLGTRSAIIGVYCVGRYRTFFVLFARTHRNVLEGWLPTVAEAWRRRLP